MLSNTRVREWQYASGDYVAELKSHGFLVGMARTGNPCENAMMESFFKTLKYEEVYLCEYETFEDREYFSLAMVSVALGTLLTISY